MNSWKNPAERIKSILNLALQSVGLMREQQSDDFEKKVKRISTLSQLRDLARHARDEGLHRTSQGNLVAVMNIQFKNIPEF